MTWEIALGIFALAAFVISIVTMTSKMTAAVSKLTESVKNLNQIIEEMRKRSHETHTELYHKIDELRDGHNDHETRIQILEKGDKK